MTYLPYRVRRAYMSEQGISDDYAARKAANAALPRFTAPAKPQAPELPIFTEDGYYDK